MQEILCNSKKENKSDSSFKSLSHSYEDELLDLVQMAATTASCPVAMVCARDNSNFSLSAKYGTSINELSEIKLLTKAGREKRLVVKDGNADEIQEPDIAFYAAIPFSLPQRNLFGVLCVFDSKQKRLSKNKTDMLRLIAGQIEKNLELLQKNEELKDLAKEQLKSKMKAIKKSLLKQEKQKKEIATRLHEQLAQALAANKLYLQVAEESEQMRLSLIRKANDSIGKLIQEICELSDAISPQTLDKMPLEELVKELIAKIKAETEINITFSITGDISDIAYSARMVLFRIIERWIKMLMFKKDVSRINIRLSNDETTVLEIEDNGYHHNTIEIANDTTTIKMGSRIEMLGGTGRLTHLAPAGNVLTIRI